MNRVRPTLLGSEGASPAHQGDRSVSLSRLRLRTAAAAVTAVVALAAGATTATAGLLVASSPSLRRPGAVEDLPAVVGSRRLHRRCRAPLRSRRRRLVADGSAVANGNEPYRVGGADRLQVARRCPPATLPRAPRSASASPSDDPLLRQAPERRLLSLSTLRVDVIFETASGHVASLPIGLVLNGGSGRPRARCSSSPTSCRCCRARRTPVASASPRRAPTGRSTTSGSTPTRK